MSLSCIMHFFNEELLIKDWILHHRSIVDYAILINHHSTDRSVEICREFMPSYWRLIDSGLNDFNAAANDREVEHYETQLLGGWRCALNVTEFLFTPGLKEKLDQLSQEHPNTQAFGTRCVQIVDTDVQDLSTPIWRNRTHGFINYDTEGLAIRRWRYIHKSSHGHYQLGRHSTNLSHINVPDLLHLHLSYSPWPQCKNRKLQIQGRIPSSDKVNRLGFEHLVDEAGLEEARERHLKLSYNLLDKPLFKEYYDELLKSYK